jgi:hypothetical protein
MIEKNPPRLEVINAHFEPMDFEDYARLKSGEAMEVDDAMAQHFIVNGWAIAVNENIEEGVSNG